MIIIYHNPRCKKSRAGLQYLETKQIEFTTRLYLKDMLTAEELASLVKLLGIEAIELVRKQEEYYKQELKGKTLGAEELIQQMVANPKLIQRPIVCDGSMAVLADPPENIDDIL